MDKIHFIFCLHNHQPVGNFDAVFEEQYQNCYLPLIQKLESYPLIKVVLHYSGSLLDWIEKSHPEFIQRVKNLMKSGRAELLGGGYYEPLLPLIPTRDAEGQIKFMQDQCEMFFGRRPEGFWLTERVWEPILPSLVVPLGLRFTCVDDTHFLWAGIEENRIRNFFLTEDHGNLLSVFPILKSLRYLIPFKSIDEIKRFFESKAKESPACILTLADDGEKFGGWPGTHRWVYEEGWLDRFFKFLSENESWLKTITFKQALAMRHSEGLVYLPTASYEEMTEWVLSPEGQLHLQNLKREFGKGDLNSHAGMFLRGGYFRNFFSKYAESRRMLQKGRLVSEKVWGIKNSVIRKKALIELWQGQCNCPYWHGVFGGLYLHHLRRSTYAHFLNAEKLADSRISKKTNFLIREHDFELDGVNELLVEGRFQNLYFSKSDGGTLVEWDYTPLSLNLLDTLTRRFESYHEAIQKTSPEGIGNHLSVSIHELVKSADPKAKEALYYDRSEKRSLRTRILAPTINLDDFFKGTFEELYQSPQEVAVKVRAGGKNPTLIFEERPLAEREVKGDIKITKHVTIFEKRIKINCLLRNQSCDRLEGLFGIEWNFTFKSECRDLSGLSEFTLWDDWSRAGIRFYSQNPFNYWQYPILTVAQSERDYSIQTQGICVLPYWRISLPLGERSDFSLELELLER